MAIAVTTGPAQHLIHIERVETPPNGSTHLIAGQASWRVLFGLQIVPTFAMGIGSFWMPESPRFLAFRGRYEETLTVLKRIHEGVKNQDAGEIEGEEFYRREFHQVKAQIELDKEENLGLKDIFKRPSYRKRVLLVIFFFLFQQVSCRPKEIRSLRNES